MLMVGEAAPVFELDALVGKDEFGRISLGAYRGRWVVLFFYPQDFTYVCPTELLAFSRKLADFRRLGAQVLACSVDSVFAHRKWIEDTLGDAGFPMLSDPTHAVSRAYGALVESKGYATRATFIIDPDGVLQWALYHNALVGRSVPETLRVLEALQSGEATPADWKRDSAANDG